MKTEDREKLRSVMHELGLLHSGFAGVTKEGYLTLTTKKDCKRPLESHETEDLLKNLVARQRNLLESELKETLKFVPDLDCMISFGTHVMSLTEIKDGKFGKELVLFHNFLDGGPKKFQFKFGDTVLSMNENQLAIIHKVIGQALGSYAQSPS